MVGGIIGDHLLRLGERAGARQVEPHSTEAEVEDMAVAVDQPGQQGPPRPVEAEVQPLGSLRCGIEQADDLAILDQQPGEAGDLAVSGERVAVDIVDQPAGRDRFDRRRRRPLARAGGAGDQNGTDRNGEGDPPHFSRRRTSDDVSCRPPPIFCTSP
jgi:hypothetical protein